MANKLKEQIEKFYQSDKDLEERMRELAKTFLFGGYINVRNQYHIYLRTVEFYYHEEDGTVKDPIMYHRNNNAIAGEIPYFKQLSFNAHETGVDITFENEKKEIRASVLIRDYEVFDATAKKLLVWRDGKFQHYVSGQKYNTQSMYLKKILTGFASEGVPDIKWEDTHFKKEEIAEDFIKPIMRRGVYERHDDENYKPHKEEKDTRLWGFRREKDIELK